MPTLSPAVEGAAATLLSGLGSNPSYAETQRVGRKLLALPAEGSAPRIRIALGGSFTVDTLANALAVECHRGGLWPIIYVDGFNQYQSHILDADSDLYGSQPDIVFVAAEADSVVPRAGDRWSETRQADILGRLEELVHAFKRNSSALVVLHNFAKPVEFPFAIDPVATHTAVQRLNELLAQRFRDDPQVRVLDYDRLCGFHGYERVTNPKLYYLGNIIYGESFLPLITEQYMAYVRALKGLARKCLVLDLDNTLWGGVIGEDGLNGIRIARDGAGSEYRDLQAAALALRERGVILAIASKNNAADALEVLRSHPEMLLRVEHFSSIQINWEDKATNLRRVAAELNIGVDSLVFVDDSDVECAWIRRELPDVKVVTLPRDPAQYASTLKRLSDFETLSVTDEDRRRGALYAEDRERRALRSSAGDFQSFVEGLEIVLTIELAGPQNVARVGQLTRKTNQFNMTTIRYADADIDKLRCSANHRVYTLKVRDVFGDSGLVGVLILAADGAAWRIDTFLMSCRVLGRMIEKAFVWEVLRDLKSRGATSVEAAFVPTAKNAVAGTFYPDAGFALRTDTGERREFVLDLASWTPPSLPRMSVEWLAADDPARELVAL